MNDGQINLIRQSFRQIAFNAEKFAERFYDNLFSIQPALQLLFPENLGEQKKKLMQMLGAAIKMLDQPEKLIPVLEDLGRRHALYGVRERHYETVGAALLKTLRETPGTDFNLETEAAWTKLYGVVSDTMKHAALELSLAPDKFVRNPPRKESLKPSPIAAGSLAAA